MGFVDLCQLLEMTIELQRISDEAFEICDVIK